MRHVQTFKHKSIFYTTVNDDTCDLQSATQKLKKTCTQVKSQRLWTVGKHTYMYFSPVCACANPNPNPNPMSIKPQYLFDKSASMYLIAVTARNC